jgi:hypothetical protein
MEYTGQLGFLAAFLCISITLTPFAVAGALKLNLSR